MRRMRVYVDNSVFGGTEDEEFADASNRFFDRVWGGHPRRTHFTLPQRRSRGPTWS